MLFTDADNFEPEEPIKKAAAMDKWEGEDEEEDVKVNHRDSHFAVTLAAIARLEAVREPLACECGTNSGLKGRRLGCGIPAWYLPTNPG